MSEPTPKPPTRVRVLPHAELCPGGLEFDAKAGRKLVDELPELRLWAVVYLWWLAMLVVLLAVPDKAIAVAIDVFWMALVVGVMAWRQKSLSLGLYSVVAWFFHAAALPIGFFHPRTPPDAWIESHLVPAKA